jgi:3-hydroxyisobutyrate dehydrogenase
MKVAMAGLGAMGAPMARNLHAKGLLHAVYNRSRDKAEALAQELGVEAPASPQALAHACDLIITCVTADADVIALCAAFAEAAKPGLVVVDTSTTASASARECAALLRAAGGDFLDAPVSGGVEGAKNAKLSIMIGGSEATLERARPALEAIGARITRMGDVGAGQDTKAVNQVHVAGIAQAVCEGLALGAALGLEPEKLLPTLASGAAGNWFLDKRGATMLRGEFAPGFKHALLLKVLQIVDALARGAGTRRDVIERSIADYAELVARGHGDEDTSALIRLKRQA